MRAFAFCLIVSLSIVDLAWAQITATPSGPATELPTYRPVLLGQGPNALINRIDSQDLIKKGQKEALVMFNCAVRKNGTVEWTGIYGATPGSDFLKQEVQKRLSPASDPRFIPGVYNHEVVDAIYYGTVTFSVVGGKPRLRIFSNQESGELSKEADFIEPQPFYGNESKFSGFHYPAEATRVLVDGLVEVKLKIDVTGNLQEISVVLEKPPLLGFGGAALADFKDAKFIPAFRDGKPVACEVTLPVFYKAAGF